MFGSTRLNHLVEEYLTHPTLDLRKRLVDTGDPAVPPLVKGLLRATGGTPDIEAFIRSTVMDIYRLIVDDIGQDAVQPLIRLLRELDEGRGVVIELLGFIEAPEAVGPLLELLRDHDEGIRCFAIKALGDIGDDRALDGLKAHKERETFDVAQDILEKTIQQLEAVARGRTGKLQASEVTRMISVLAADEGVSPDEKLERVHTLYHKGGDHALAPLLVALLAEDSNIRGGAGVTLSRLRLGCEIKPVSPIYSWTAPVETMQSFAMALAAVGRRAVPVLVISIHAMEQACTDVGLYDGVPITDLRQGRVVKVLNTLKVALSSVRDPMALAPLIKAIADPSPHVRSPATMAVGRVRDPMGQLITRQAVEQALRDPDRDVRISAREAYERLMGVTGAH